MRFTSCKNERKIQKTKSNILSSHCLHLIKESRINVYTEEVNFSHIILFNGETKIKKPFLIFEAKQIEVRKNSLKVFVKFDYKQGFI